MVSNEMLEAHVSEDTTVSIHRVPIPKLVDPHSVLIRVHAISTNPKDWKMPAKLLTTIGDRENSGDDCSGIVAAIGSAVTNLHIGQRVAALHELGALHGSFAEYCLCEDFSCIHIPDSLSYEDAATLPMAFFMAATSLYSQPCLGIASGPWDIRSPGHPMNGEPLLVYGASTAVGGMAIKLARLNNIHPIICIAGKAKQWVADELLDASRGDIVLDYRDGPETLEADLRSALKGKKARYALDAASQNGSYISLARVLEPDGNIALTLPGKASKELLEADDGKYKTLRIIHVMAGSLWKPLKARNDGSSDLGKLGFVEGGNAFARAMAASMAGLLADGKIKARPYEVVPGGLRGLETALQNLRQGKNSGSSYVVRFDETDRSAQ